MQWKTHVDVDHTVRLTLSLPSTHIFCRWKVDPLSLIRTRFLATSLVTGVSERTDSGVIYRFERKLTGPEFMEAWELGFKEFAKYLTGLSDDDWYEYCSMLLRSKMATVMGYGMPLFLSFYLESLRKRITYLETRIFELKQKKRH